MGKKWTEEMKAAQSERLKRAWASREAREMHSAAMKEHWEERRKKLTPAPRLTTLQRLDHKSAIASLASIKEFVERQVGTQLSLAQTANIICSYYARNHNVQS